MDNLLTGNINTIILDPRTGQIKTTVFTHDELGPENPVLVPLSAYSVEAIEKTIRTDASSNEVSAAPQISPDNIKQRANESGFVQQIRNYWVRTSLGTVEDYIITKDGRMLYLLVRPDDLFEQHDRLYPIPVQAITLDRVMKEALVGLEEKDFEELPSLEGKNAVNTAVANWDKWITDYWTTRLIGKEGIPFLHRSPKTALGRKAETPVTMFMSDFLPFRVFNNKDVYMGGVEDAIVSLEEGTIDFVITTYSPTFVDLGRKQIPVPFESLTIPESSDRVMVEADRQTLRSAPGMENIDITDKENREWVNTVKEYWK